MYRIVDTNVSPSNNGEMFSDIARTIIFFLISAALILLSVNALSAAFEALFELFDVKGGNAVIARFIHALLVLILSGVILLILSYFLGKSISAAFPNTSSSKR